jgi:hypothetical protein
MTLIRCNLFDVCGDFALLHLASLYLKYSEQVAGKKKTR